MYLSLQSTKCEGLLFIQSLIGFGNRKSFLNLNLPCFQVVTPNSSFINPEKNAKVSLISHDLAKRTI